MQKPDFPRTRSQKPYKNSDGFAYIRVQRVKDGTYALPMNVNGVTRAVFVNYDDNAVSTRIIGANRAESAVEVHDFLDILNDGHHVTQMGISGSWSIHEFDADYHILRSSEGASLREAYYRLMAMECRSF